MLFVAFQCNCSIDCVTHAFCVFHLLHGSQEHVIEKEISMGQLEELIEQAEDELSVIPVYLGELGVFCC